MRRIEDKERELQELLSKLQHDVGPVYWYDTVLSTMDVGFEHSDAADRTVIVADRQTRGRGRYGRLWYSEEGSLYCSIVLTRFDIRLPYSMIAAYGVYRALMRHSDRVKLKWINDVMWENGRKISGVIAEERRQRTVIGIGVNLNNLKFHKKIEMTATSYRRETGECIGVAEFLRDMADEFFSLLAAVDKDGIERVMAEWETDASVRGRAVRIVDSSRELLGTSTGIDKRTGALLLHTEEGDVKVYEGSLFYR
ncbi:MAG TPA: biotin--[acetyl-CoA-carboxylase] ligase [Spirochaetota bacterium]|nr:biotin--[acetyl-CoA-carboxylase] ligase [Spirochaetota bacterium]